MLVDPEAPVKTSVDPVVTMLEGAVLMFQAVLEVALIVQVPEPRVSVPGAGE